MQESTIAIPLNENHEAQRVEDLRNPVGLDAGAPEVTDAAEDVGGWHGGAEDAGKREVEQQQEVEAKGRVRVDDVPEMRLDAEARRIAEAAMKADEV